MSGRTGRRRPVQRIYHSGVQGEVMEWGSPTFLNHSTFPFTGAVFRIERLTKFLRKNQCAVGHALCPKAVAEPPTTTSKILKAKVTEWIQTQI